MAVAEVDYVEDHDYDEEEDDDDYDIEEDDEGDVEDADMEEEDPAELMQNAEFIRGLEPLLGARGGPGATSGPSSQSNFTREWTGLRKLPGTTQATFLELLGELRDQKKTKLTILLIGKAGVGKSSTANSILAEKVAHVAVMQSDMSKAQSISRTAAGFNLTIIDTPGALEGDALNGAALAGIAYEIRGKPIDVVLYVNRLDDYRVDASDVQVIEGVTRVLGENIWDNAFIALTHGRLTSLPGNLSYDEYVEKRADALRRAIRQNGGNKSAELPVVLIENSSRALTNPDGEKLLGNKRPWLPDLMREVTQKSMEWKPYKYSAEVVRRHDPNKRRRWLIPLVLLAQIAFKILVLDRVLEEDGVTGDAYGPFEPDFVQEERARIKRDKERERKRREAEKLRQKQGGDQPSRGRVIESPDDDFSDDEDEY